MTISREDNINAVAGSAQGVATKAELKAESAIGGYLYEDDSRPKDLKSLGSRIVNAINWHYESLVDVEKSTKYRANPVISYYGNGGFSMNPLIGKYVLTSVENEETYPALDVDKSNSSIKSTSRNTTLGSKNIDTLDGKQMNPLGDFMPSSFYTPQKTWVQKMFPMLSDKSLVYITILEAIQVAIFAALKGTKSEQIIKSERKDVSTIIVDNQEIEDKIFAKVRGQ